MGHFCLLFCSAREGHAGDFLCAAPWSGRDRTTAWRLRVVGPAWLLGSEEGSPCGRGAKAGAPRMKMPALTPWQVTD